MNKLNHSVTIERATLGLRNERGEQAETWSATPASPVRASVQPLTSRDLAQLGQGGPVASTHKIYMLPTDVTPADRIVEGSTTYQIDAVYDQAGAGHHLRLDVHSVAV